jgi:hypothetical protein
MLNRLSPLCSTFALMLVALGMAGCGGADPLGMDHRRGPGSAADGNAGGSKAASGTDGEKRSDTPAVTPQPLVVAPTLVEPKYVDTRPGELPSDLARILERSADLLASNQRETALEILVDLRKLEAERSNYSLAAKNMPEIVAVLMAGKLKQALKTPPRLTSDGQFALFEVSDSSHVRFEKLEGRWRLSDNLRPDSDTPGLKYDDAPEHAALLLRKLAGVETAATEAAWSEAEKRVVEPLLKAGAGIAQGKNASGQVVVAVVIPEAFRGGESEVSGLKSINGLQIVADYTNTDSPLAMPSLAGIPGLKAVRLLPRQLTDPVVAAVGKLKGLTTLSLNSRQQATVSLAPLTELTSLTRLELNSLTFARDDLKVLRTMPGLRQLDLSRSTLDDKYLEQLFPLTNLQRVMISTEMVTAEGVKKLRDAVPNLFIDW